MKCLVFGIDVCFFILLVKVVEIVEEEICVIDKIVKDRGWVVVFICND